MQPPMQHYIYKMCELADMVIIWHVKANLYLFVLCWIGSYNSNDIGFLFAKRVFDSVRMKRLITNGTTIHAFPSFVDVVAIEVRSIYLQTKQNGWAFARHSYMNQSIFLTQTYEKLLRYLLTRGHPLYATSSFYLFIYPCLPTHHHA